MTGVPIDVVELYDEWGNRGQPSAGNAGTAPTGPATGSSASTEANPPSQGTQTTTSGAPAPASAPQTNVEAERTTQQVEQQFQGLNIGNAGDTTNTNADGESMTSASGSSAPLINLVSTGAEMDGEGGWTMLEADKVCNN
jgi:hypothetical protein